jgi:hypothetical protein
MHDKIDKSKIFGGMIKKNSKNQIRFDNVFWNAVDHKTKPKPLGFDAICTQARLPRVLFLTKTKLKPKKKQPIPKHQIRAFCAWFDAKLNRMS